MKRLLALGSAALLLTSCTTPGPSAAGPTAAPPAATGRQAPPVAARLAGGYGFTRLDTPYAQVAAEARRTGRPMLIYFWTSW